LVGRPVNARRSDGGVVGDFVLICFVGGIERRRSSAARGTFCFGRMYACCMVG
jgi:hypothetical protein